MTTKEFRGLSSSSRVNCILRALRASLYSPSTRDAAISEHNATCFEKERIVGGRGGGKEKKREERRNGKGTRVWGEIKRRAMRRSFFFYRQPLWLDPCNLSLLLREGSSVSQSCCKTSLNEVNCSESNWDLRYVLALFAEARVKISRSSKDD